MKEGEAESYLNVTIQWSKGAPPVLSIYNTTGHKTNSINLAEYDDKDRLNALMVEQGFRKMNEEETKLWQQKKKEQKQREVDLAAKRREKLLEERAKKVEENGGDPKVVRLIDKEPIAEEKDLPKPSPGGEL